LHTAHNTFLGETTTGIRARLAPFRRAQFEMRNRLYASCDEHDAIMAALLSGDGALASERMRAHVNAVRLVSAHYVRSLASSDSKQHGTQRRASM